MTGQAERAARACLVDKARACSNVLSGLLLLQSGRAAQTQVVTLPAPLDTMP